MIKYKNHMFGAYIVSLENVWPKALKKGLAAPSQLNEQKFSIFS